MTDSVWLAPPERRRSLARWWLLAATLLLSCDDRGGATTVVDRQTADDGGLDASALEPSVPDASERDTGSAVVDAAMPAPAVRDAGVRPVVDAQRPIAAADAGVDSAVVEALEAAVDAGPSPIVDAAVRPDAALAASLYDVNARWLCRPGLPNNPCAETIQVTDVHADGGTTVSELPKTPDDVKADCLYLYPTIDPGLLAPPRNLDFDEIDMVAVRDIFAGQAVPFREACAIWAPVYRQTSLTSFEQPDTRERGLSIAYRDLEAAFDYYLQHAPGERPIVLLAHSQGAIVMSRLIKQRFEGHPELLRRLVVAVLAGPLGGFVVPVDKLVGGTFAEVPLCSAERQTGCVLTYATFAAKRPPNADYGRVNGGVMPGFDTGCTTPPGGPTGAAARMTGALFASMSGPLGALAPQFDYGRLRVRTQLARYADFYTASCEKSVRGLSYLRVTADPLKGDVRVDPVLYDSVTLNSPEVGLHGIDYAFVSGDLLRTVKTRLAAHAN